MYLGALSKEIQHLFVELEICMSEIDGDFSEEEKQIIDAHCIEMHVDNNNYECVKNADNVIVDIVSKSTQVEKNIVFLELTATVMADGTYHESEKKVMKRIQEKFSISEEKKNNAFEIIAHLKTVYNECSNFVKGI